MLTLKDPHTIIAKDLNVIGAAVKIIAAGGSSLDANGQRKASGASYYLWNAKGPEILELAKQLEAVPAPSEG